YDVDGGVNTMPGPRIARTEPTKGVCMGVLDEKVAIVTGSARGIGRATAELLAEHGARVVINDLDGDLARQMAGEIGGETAVHAGDLTKDGFPEALGQTPLAPWGRPG